MDANEKSKTATKSHDRRLLMEIGAKLGIVPPHLSAWYRVTQAQLFRYGGLKLKKKDRSSIIKYLKLIYPEHPWDRSRFIKFPRAAVWSIFENQRSAMLWIGEQLGIQENEYHKWYKIPIKAIASLGGSSLARRFKANRLALLSAVFPEHAWDPDAFEPRLRDHWGSLENQRKELERIGRELGIQEGEYEKWYTVPWSAVTKRGGDVLFHHATDKVSILRGVFPEHDWDVTLFRHKPKDYWISAENQRAELVRFGKAIGIKQSDYASWYKVTLEDLYKNGLSRLVKAKGTRYKIFSSVFPEYDWKPWLFANKVDLSSEEWKELARDIERQLEISRPEDWYSVRKEQIQKIGVKRLLPSQLQLMKMLRLLYPDFNWDIKRFYFGSYGKGTLLAHLLQLFGAEVALSKDFFSGLDREWDVNEFQKAIVLPRFKVLFDYQGPQYFASLLIARVESLEAMNRPQLAKWANENGFTLITVPFWAERNLETLLAELWTRRSDLFAEGGPLKRFLNTAQSHPGIQREVAVPTLSVSYFQSWARDDRFKHLFENDQSFGS